MRPGPHPQLYGVAAHALRAAGGDSGGRTVIGILGPRGTGKTAVLEALAAGFAEHGAPVHRRPGDAARARATGAGQAGTRPALLVDDAHELGDDELLCLCELARDDAGPDLIVAARPPVDRPQVCGVYRQLELVGTEFVLDRIDASDVRAWAHRVLGRDPGQAAAERLHQLTDGAPWLVERMLEACRDGRDGRLHAEPPPGLVHRLALDLERLDADVAELALALAVGFDLRSPMLPASPRFQPGELDRVVKSARVAGLLRDDDRLIPLIAAAILRAAPAHRVGAMQLKLIEELSKHGRPLDPALADAALTVGLRDPRLADALVRAGDAHLLADPARANDHYTAALAAGAESRDVRARQAQAALAVGDTGAAGRLIEQHVIDGEPRDLARTVDVAAAYWAARCLPTRSAEVYRWCGAERAGASAPLAAVALFGAGERDEAARMLGVASAAFPTGTSISARKCGEALRASMARDPSLALPLLVRASSTLTATGTSVPMPELPAALAAMAAMHSGDLDAAASVLDDAIAGQQGGSGAVPRLRLLRAWASMLAGEASRAREESELARQHPYPFAPRDELFARSLEVGLARRADDLQALMRSWQGVREFVMTVGTGLFTLLPLGELVVAAARMRDTKAIEPALAEAWALLERLGDPPLWSSTLRWACVQAGIIANRPDELPPHAAALVRGSREFPLAAVLAEAGRTWVRILGGRLDAAAAEAAAARLAAAGLPWDGARLAAHAAGRADERKDMLRLLQVARELYGDRAALAAGAPGGSPPVIDPASRTRRGEAPPAEREPSPRSARRDGGEVSARPLANGAVRKRRGRAGATQSGAQGARPPARRPAPDARGRQPAAVPVSPAAAERLANRLSERERDVVRLVLAGKTYAEIGAALFISPRTAEHHIARVRRRIGASSRSEMLDVLHSAFDGQL